MSTSTSVPSDRDMADVLSTHRAVLHASMSASAPAMVLDAEGTALDQPAAFGTRVITRHRSGAHSGTTAQTPAAPGWWVQGIRKIGDRLFIERVAL